MTQITSFSGEYRFLSNFWLCKFLYQGYEWPSAEHCYQAMKRIDHDYWIKILDPSVTPGKAKRMGAAIDMDVLFKPNRLNYMRGIVTAKFDQNPDLMELLKSTAPAEIIEGNTWGDTFWGQCPIGTGRNELGKLLMSIRDDITRLF
jgi:ribA/ribD-fused uncharacterized protein